MSPRTVPRTSQTILVVEDDPDVSDLICEVLEEEGFGVTLAKTGVDALENLARRRPALVVLDVMLPDIYGEGVANALRAAYAGVPIILTSALPITVDETLAVGAATFLRKPFGPDALLAAVHSGLAVAS